MNADEDDHLDESVGARNAALDPEEALRRFQRITVLGDPGAGRTTMFGRAGNQARRRQPGAGRHPAGSGNDFRARVTSAGATFHVDEAAAMRLLGDAIALPGFGFEYLMVPAFGAEVADAALEVLETRRAIRG